MRPRDLQWSPLLLVIAVYLMSAVGRIHQLFEPIGWLRPVMVSSLFAIVLLALDLGTARRVFHLIRIPLVTCLVALVVWATLSIPTALAQGRAFTAVADGLMKTVLMAAVIGAAVRGTRDVHRLALTFFAATATFALVAVARFGGGERLAGMPYYDANDFAVLAVVGVPFGLYGLRYARHRIARVLCALGLAVMGTAFVWSGSRGGFLALAVVIVFGLWRVSAVSRTWRVAGLAVIVAAVVLTATDTYWQRIRSIAPSAQDYNRTSESGRWQVWQRGIGYIMQRPLTGVGADNFEVAEGTISPLAKRQELGYGVKWSAAHNSYIQVAAELGIPGLLFFLGAFIAAIRLLNREQRLLVHDPPLRALAQLTSVSLMGYAAGAMFLSLAYADMLYAVYAMALAISVARRLQFAAARSRMV